ncbi:hypothetical protein ACVWZV_005636 [Bradyrhizobium sp. GM5.1]
MYKSGLCGRDGLLAKRRRWVGGKRVPQAGRVGLNSESSVAYPTERSVILVAPKSNNVWITGKAVVERGSIKSFKKGSANIRGV